MALLLGPGATSAALELVNLGTDWSSGDLLASRVAVPPAAHKFDLRDGTAGAPAKAGVTISASRTDATTVKEIEGAGLGTDPSDGATLMRLAIKGTPASEVQVSALVASAWQTGAFAEPFADACPIIMYGRVSGGATGRALASYGEISIETATARGGEVHELRVKNSTGEDHSYLFNAGSKSMGTWTRAGGTKNSAAAHQIGEGVGGRSFEGGYTINAGAVSGFGYRDDSSSLRSILIKGTHEKAAIAVAKGSGQVVVGAETPSAASALLEVYSEATADPIVQFGSDKAVSISTVVAKMSTASLKAFGAGAAGAFLTDTVQGSTGLTFTPGKPFHIGANGKASILRAEEAKLGFFGKAPQARPNVKAASEVTSKELCEALETLGLVE